MESLSHLSAQDRADFEQVLRQALTSPETERALRQAGAGLDASQLRAEALRAIAEIAAAAEAEHRTYVRLRDCAATSGTADTVGQFAGTGDGAGMPGQGLPAALAVLAPILAGAAAAVLLLLGYGLGLVDSQRALADVLVASGWSAAVIAAVLVVADVVGLLIAASRNHCATPDGRSPDEASDVSHARRKWRRALLGCGVRPFLRGRLQEALLGGADSPKDSTGARAGGQLGFSSPDFSGPGYAAPGLPDRDSGQSR